MNRSRVQRQFAHFLFLPMDPLYNTGGEAAIASRIAEKCCHKMRILVIEDEVRLSEFVKRGLAEQTFAVDVANDGPSGLDFALTYDYDAIILDLMLPGMHGGSILRKLRAAKKDVPVLVLTARNTLIDKVEHLELGADDYLTKPFAIVELVARIKALVRRSAGPRAAVLRVADLELDRMSQQARRGTQRIELTAKEYALLEYLMSNTGRVLTRSMIIEHVWDQSFDGITNIVDVYIAHLRSKIDAGHPRKLLRTMRGSGYTLRDPEGDDE
jgi:DNA-binding response OmpR family regulator